MADTVLPSISHTARNNPVVCPKSGYMRGGEINKAIDINIGDHGSCGIFIDSLFFFLDLEFNYCDIGAIPARAQAQQSLCRSKSPV